MFKHRNQVVPKQFASASLYMCVVADGSTKNSMSLSWKMMESCCLSVAHTCGSCMYAPKYRCSSVHRTLACVKNLGVTDVLMSWKCAVHGTSLQNGLLRFPSRELWGSLRAGK